MNQLMRLTTAFGGPIELFQGSQFLDSVSFRSEVDKQNKAGKSNIRNWRAEIRVPLISFFQFAFVFFARLPEGSRLAQLLPRHSYTKDLDLERVLSLHWYHRNRQGAFGSAKPGPKQFSLSCPS